MGAALRVNQMSYETDCKRNIVCQREDLVNLFKQALTGERIHDECFVCGPKGVHYQPPLPPYPHKWDFFINNRKTSGISRKLNNIFSLTAIGVYDSDFMKFPDGIAAINLAGGHTYHRMLPSHEGQHAI
jgi:hypothetical protein